MKKSIVFILLLAFLVECARVPLTGRRQVRLLPESMLLDMSLQQYSQVMQQANVVTGTPDALMVERVGNNIARASEEFLRRNNQTDRIRNFRWEFNLIQDASANAWAMPGGKIAFHTGILPYTQNEPGLATVMGHEVAHAVARHGNERLSQMLALQMGGIALDVALSQQPEQTRQLFMTAYGLGAQIGVLLPYSRLHETEADRMGLVFMAMAGYHPEEAINFWTRMQAAATGAAIPEFLSTHPSHGTRIRDLQEYMPVAMRYYRPQQ